MAVNFFLTDEEADVGGYLRAKLGSPSDVPSLVQSVTATEAGASSGVQLTRASGGTAIKWITDPLDGTNFTSANWVLHLWAKESAAAANAAIRLQVIPYVVSEGSAFFDNNAGTELGTTTVDLAITAASGGTQTNADGDRVVFILLIDDAGTMGADATVTFSYNGLYSGGEGYSYITCPDNTALTAARVAAIRTRIRRVLKDTDSTNPFIADNEIDEAFVNALSEFSRDRPLVVVSALSGDGSTSDFPLPGKWALGKSLIRHIEHPTGNAPPTFVNPENYGIIEQVAARQPQRLLQFLSTPASGTDNVRVTYTANHVWDDVTATVPESDQSAMISLAGAYAARAAEARAAATQDSTLGLDATDYGGAAARWHQIANDLRRRYDDHIGGADATPVGASVTQDWDQTAQTAGGFIFHSRRRR